MKNDNEIENKYSFLDKSKIFNIFKSNKLSKSRNTKNNSKNIYKKNKTSLDNDYNQRNNKFIFRTADNKNEHDTKKKLNEEIAIISKKYLSLSYEKINKTKTLQLTPLKTNKQNNKSASDFKEQLNINLQKESKYFSNNNLFPKKLPFFEKSGNMEIIKNSEIIKIPNEDIFMKNSQLNSIVEEINEEENDIKSKLKNNTVKVFCDDEEEGKKYNSNFSYDKDINYNIAINSTGRSTKFSTGKLTNNIFDIPSDDDNNIIYIEKNNIENEKEIENKTFTDIEHDSENTFLNSIKLNENDNSISFMNDINLCLSPLKKGLNNIDYNNLVINKIKYYNNSALNKKNNNSLDEIVIKNPGINNNFEQRNIFNLNLNNVNNNDKNKSNTYIKKKIIKPDKFMTYSFNNSLIIPKNLSNQKKNSNKIKEKKIFLKKEKIFLNDNQKINKVNKDCFIFNNFNIKSIIFIKEKKYTKIMIVPITNVKSIQIDNNISIKEIEQIRKNSSKLDLSNLNNKNLSDDKDNLYSSTVITTLASNTQDSENKIKNINNEINHLNLFAKNKNNNIHSRNKNKNRNKIERKNFSSNEKFSQINLSNRYNSNEINKNINEIENNSNQIDILNNIKKNDINLNYENQHLEENIFYISIKSYEEFIQDFINQTQNILNELLKDNSQFKMNLQNEIKDVDLDNLLLDLEKHIKLLKYNYLHVLVKKHYTKEKKDKINTIKSSNIIKKRKNFSAFYQKMICEIKQKTKLDNIEYTKKYINKIIEILNLNKTISSFEIKYSKKIYNEETKFSPEILYFRFDKIKDENNIKEKNGSILKILKDNGIIDKKIIISTTIIIIILYGMNYLSSFYNSNDNNYK